MFTACLYLDCRKAKCNKTYTCLHKAPSGWEKQDKARKNMESTVITDPQRKAQRKHATLPMEWGEQRLPRRDDVLLNLKEFRDSVMTSRCQGGHLLDYREHRGQWQQGPFATTLGHWSPCSRWGAGGGLQRGGLYHWSWIGQLRPVYPALPNLSTVSPTFQEPSWSWARWGEWLSYRN